MNWNWRNETGRDGVDVVTRGERAPYVSYKSFRAALASLPIGVSEPRINVTRLLENSISDGSRRQVLTAFRFFGLIDQQSHSTSLLDDYLSHAAKDRHTILSQIASKTYGVAELRADGSMVSLSEIAAICQKYSSSVEVKVKIANFCKEMLVDVGYHIVNQKGVSLKSILQNDAKGHSGQTNARSRLAGAESQNNSSATEAAQNNSECVAHQGQNIRNLLDAILKLLAHMPPRDDELPGICLTVHWLSRLLNEID
jgi:hypothetical protein